MEFHLNQLVVADSVAWYNTLLVSSSTYDKDNVDYLPNNIPQYIQNDDEQTDFILFLDMIGSHFDILWSYVRASKKKLNCRRTTTSWY